MRGDAAAAKERDNERHLVTQLYTNQYMQNIKVINKDNNLKMK